MSTATTTKEDSGSKVVQNPYSLKRHVSTKMYDDQYPEWVVAGWEPRRIVTIIDRLEDLAIPVTWSKNLRDKLVYG
jgi:hypothetical protein